MSIFGTVRKMGGTVLDLGVYMPIGVALKTRDTLMNRDKLVGKYHGFVERGRDGLGLVADRTGSRIERIRVEAKETGQRAASTARVAKARAKVTPTVSELPIARYDQLTAQEIVAELGSLTQIQLQEIEAYEVANQDRSTIIQAIDTRLVELPISGYDEMTADEILKELGYLSKEELRTVRDYENRTQDRKTVLEHIESLVGV
jgi:uncharacterized protein (DUF433 family)